MDFQRLKLAAAALLIAPCVPLLFMGEEYGEPAPFQYVTDFGDPGLQAAVTRGRREEFAAFGWTDEIPDPQDPATFRRSVLTWGLREREPNRQLLDFYRTLLALRRRFPTLGVGGKRRMTVRTLEEQVLAVTRWAPDGGAALALLHFGSEARTVRLRIRRGSWARLVDSAEERFGGPGARSAQRLSASPAGRVEVMLEGHAAAIYIRDAPDAVPPGRAVLGQGIPPNDQARSA